MLAVTRRLALWAGECQPLGYHPAAMPIYEYRCKKGHTFEVRQSFSDANVTTCEVCGAPVERVYHPIAVHFKGSGFYNTDYGTRQRSRELKEAKEAKSNSESASKSDSSSSDSSSGGSGDSGGSDSSSGSDKSSSTGSGASKGSDGTSSTSSTSSTKKADSSAKSK